MKIGIISDLHLGFRQYGSLERENDFYNHFLKICKEINKKEVDIVIIAGDIFDKPNPSPKAISVYREGISNLNCDVVLAIKGNHTMIARDNHYSIDEFFGSDEFEGYYLLEDGSWSTQMFSLESPYDSEYNKYKDMKIRVDGITYRSESNIDDFISVQNLLAAEKVEDNTFRILVVHQAFKEFCGFTGETLSIHDINYDNYDVVICGHIHSRFNIKIDNDTWFIQPGSIERMNTTEALDEQRNGKGFYVLDTEKKSVDFYKVSCPRKFFLGDVKICNEDDCKNHFDELEKNLLKLKEPAIISYNYKSYLENISLIRDKISLLKENVLLNKSNVYDETEENVSLDVSENNMPSVQQAIKMYGEKSKLNDNEVKLATDLFNVLGNSEDDASKILEDYFEKNIKKEKNFEFKDEELEEIIEYFMR